MIADPVAICSALGGKWRGRSGMCRCPAHEDRTASLSVGRTSDGRPLVHCFAGCDQMGVITALRRMALWPETGELVQDPSWPHRLTVPHDRSGLDQDMLKRRELARDIWAKSLPIEGTAAEIYLRRRGVTIKLPPKLRFHPRLKLGDRTHPCMVAAIQDEAGRVCAIQRTFLEPDGRDRIRPSDGGKGKLTLGPMGSGAVRLGKPYSALGLAEGIETALSAKQRYSLPVWATLSANRLGQIAIPDGVRQIVIFADAGRVGIEQAREAVSRYADQGLTCQIETPPEGFGDFNDVLRAEVA